MAIIQNNIIKTKPFQGTRLTITATASTAPSDTIVHYSEGFGNRYYVSSIGAGQATDYQNASFEGYLSFTSSSNEIWQFNLIPLEDYETVFIELKIQGMIDDGSRAMMQRTFAGFKHDGSSVTEVQDDVSDILTNFVSANINLIAGTDMVILEIQGDTGSQTDWDIFFSYRKGYHTPAVQGGKIFTNPINIPR